MRFKKFFIFPALLMCMSCATVSEDKYEHDILAMRDTYQKTIEELRTQLNENTKKIESLEEIIRGLRVKLDEYENGPDRLLSKAKIQIEDNKLQDAVKTLELLRASNPESAEWKQYGSVMLSEVKRKIEEENVLAAQEEEERLKRISAAMSKLYKKSDQFQEYDYYYDSTSPSYVNENGFYAYFGVGKGDIGGLHLRIQNVDKNPLDITEIFIKTDTNIYTIEINENLHKNGIADNGFWESYDFTDIVRPEIFDKEYKSCKLIILLNDIASSKSVYLRLVGRNYSKDIQLTMEQVQAIRNVIDGYQYLTSQMVRK